MIDQAVSVKRNVHHYRAYLAAFQPQHLVTHFPKVIQNPDSTQFAYSSGPLQASSFIQLRMTLDSDALELISEMAATKAIARYQGGDKYHHFNQDQENNYPTTYFHTNQNDPSWGYSFPDHFKLYVYSAADQQTILGRTSGIAISNETNTVVYWADGGGD